MTDGKYDDWSTPTLREVFFYRRGMSVEEYEIERTHYNEYFATHSSLYGYVPLWKKPIEKETKEYWQSLNKLKNNTDILYSFTKDIPKGKTYNEKRMFSYCKYKGIRPTDLTDSELKSFI